MYVDSVAYGYISTSIVVECKVNYLSACKCNEHTIIKNYCVNYCNIKV